MIAETATQWAREKETGSAWQFRLMRWLALNAPSTLTDTLIWFIALVYAFQTRRPSTA